MASESMWEAADDPTSDVTGESLVRCLDVSHDYQRDGGGSRWPWSSSQASPAVTALEDVSLQIDRGEVVGLEGPSGKSTRFRRIAPRS